MGVGDFLIKAGTSVLGGMGRQMEYESSPEAKLARETQERNLRTDAIAASQEQRQVAQEERNAATGKLKTIIDVLGAKPEIRKQIIASPETKSIEKALGLPSGTFSSINKLGNDNTDLLLNYIGTRVKEPQKLINSMKEVLGGKTFNEQLLALDPILKQQEFAEGEEALNKLTTSQTPEVQPQIEPVPDIPDTIRSPELNQKAINNARIELDELLAEEEVGTAKALRKKINVLRKSIARIEESSVLFSQKQTRIDSKQKQIDSLEEQLEHENTRATAAGKPSIQQALRSPIIKNAIIKYREGRQKIGRSPSGTIVAPDENGITRKWTLKEWNDAFLLDEDIAPVSNFMRSIIERGKAGDLIELIFLDIVSQIGGSK
jgi:hypothetical protein